MHFIAPFVFAVTASAASHVVLGDLSGQNLNALSSQKTATLCSVTMNENAQNDIAIKEVAAEYNLKEADLKAFSSKNCAKPHRVVRRQARPTTMAMSGPSAAPNGPINNGNINSNNKFNFGGPAAPQPAGVPAGGRFPAFIPGPPGPQGRPGAPAPAVAHAGGAPAPAVAHAVGAPAGGAPAVGSPARAGGSQCLAGNGADLARVTAEIIKILREAGLI